MSRISAPHSRPPRRDSRPRPEPRQRKALQRDHQSICERGQALVELALTLPILVVMLVGLAELGNSLNAYLTVIAVARDAARLGAQGTATDADLRSLISAESTRLPNAIPSACSPGNAGICITRGTNPPPESIQVQVCYDHSLIIGVPGILTSPLKMCSQTTMRVLSS